MGGGAFPSAASYTADLRRARRAADGDSASTAAIVREMAPIVDRLARAACRRQPAEAPDLAQEALIACVRPKTLLAYTGQGPLRSYLQVVAHWRIIALVRTRAWDVRQHQEQLSQRWAGTAGGHPVEEVAVGSTFIDELESALASEPPRVELILKAKADGFTDEELAAILGCPPGTVKSAWHRARTRLAVKLQHWEPR